MKRYVATLLAGLVAALAGTGMGADRNTDAAVRKIRQLSAAVQSFKADLHVIDRRGTKDDVSTSILSASRSLGWKIEGQNAEGRFEIASDYKSMTSYDSAENKVYKMQANHPQAVAMLRKVITDLNPLDLISSDTIHLAGEESLNGEKVLHFEGTTVTKGFQRLPPVTRKLQAWVSPVDGLPRKTIETVGESSGITIYSNVRVNIPVTASDFTLDVPQGAQVMNIQDEANQPPTPVHP